jgi:hypothetical protein
VVPDSGEDMVLGQDATEGKMQSTHAKDSVKKEFIAFLKGELNSQFGPERGLP